MEDRTILTNGCTVGLDLGDKYSHHCVLGTDGEVVQEGRLRTTPDALRAFFSSLGAIDTCRVALEVGTHSPWVSRLLAQLGQEVIVANPRQLRLIYKNKCDKVDAQNLARLARLDPNLLKPMRHRGAAAQADLAIVRARDALVGVRTKLVNHIRGAVKSFGGRLPADSTHSFAKKMGAYVPAELKSALEPVLKSVQELTDRIQEYDRQVAGLAGKYPDSKKLQQIAGVGPLTSVSFILTLEDPTRFQKSRTVGLFLGLRPAKNDSGEYESQLRITKAGDMYLRRLLVGSAHYILGPFGPDTDMRRWGTKLFQRGGKNAKKRAVVAVARKLAVLLHQLWISGQRYEPLRNALRKADSGNSRVKMN